MYPEHGEERVLASMDLSVCVCSALLAPPSVAVLQWAPLGPAALGVPLVLKIQDVVASSVWGNGGRSNSCSQFSRGLHFGVEPEPSHLPLIQGKVWDP